MRPALHHLANTRRPGHLFGPSAFGGGGSVKHNPASAWDPHHKDRAPAIRTVFRSSAWLNYNDEGVTANAGRCPDVGQLHVAGRSSRVGFRRLSQSGTDIHVAAERSSWHLALPGPREAMFSVPPAHIRLSLAFGLTGAAAAVCGPACPNMGQPPRLRSRMEDPGDRRDPILAVTAPPTRPALLGADHCPRVGQRTFRSSTTLHTDRAPGLLSHPGTAASMKWICPSARSAAVPVWDSHAAAEHLIPNGARPSLGHRRCGMT